MKYPTKEQVLNGANREQLARWSRFLPSPGSNAIGTPEFDDALKEEKEILDLILSRLKEEGGMSSALSKKIGWDL